MKTALLFTALILATPIQAEGLNFKLESVYDGDTFKVSFNCDIDVLCKNIPIRINKIDTPEIRTRCSSEKILGFQSKYKLSTLLFKAKNIELQNMKRGKFYRVVADVYADGRSVSEYMIKHGYATPYFGGKRVRNCNE